ncbi:MAG TPA: sigma-54 dependent transcriptional regulator [Bryobacteraceae bacterium]
MQFQALIFAPPECGTIPRVCDALTARNYRIQETRTSAELLHLVEIRFADLVVLAAGPGCNWAGIDASRAMRQIDRRCPLLLMTKDASEDFLIAVLRAGISDLLKDTCDAREAGACVDRLTALFQTCTAGAQCLIEGARMVGNSASMQRVREEIGKVAAPDTNVLITGETGTGKELAAELIHRNSGRRAKPFVSINCAAIPDGLLESELFGYERGAFTGANAAREGKLQFANGGTVFLDEIGDMNLHSQAKILRAVESRHVQRLGGHRNIPLDIRIVAATNQSLEGLISQGRFRQDLYFRLNVARIHLPPLRERTEDIPALFEHMLDELNRSSNRTAMDIDPELAVQLQHYEWPGNVRELRNVIESAFVFCSTRRITLADVAAPVRERLQPPMDHESAERERVLHALTSTQWNKSEAARILHWSRMTLYRKMTKFQIQSHVERKPPTQCNSPGESVTA